MVQRAAAAVQPKKKPARTPKRKAVRPHTGGKSLVKPKKSVWQLEGEEGDDTLSDITLEQLVNKVARPPTETEFNNDIVDGHELLFNGVYASIIIAQAEAFVQEEDFRPQWERGAGAPTGPGILYRLLRLEYFEDFARDTDYFVATYKMRLPRLECGLIPTYPDAVIRYRLTPIEAMFEAVANSMDEILPSMFVFERMQADAKTPCFNRFLLVLDVGGDAAVGGGPDFSQFLQDIETERKQREGQGRSRGPRDDFGPRIHMFMSQAFDDVPGYMRSEVRKLQRVNDDKVGIARLRGYQTIRAKYINTKRENNKWWPHCPPLQSLQSGLQNAPTSRVGRKRPIPDNTSSRSASDQRRGTGSRRTNTN